MAGAAGGGGNWRQATSFLRRLSITGKAGQLKCQGQAARQPWGVGIGSRPAHTPGVLSGVIGPVPLSLTTCHHPGISRAEMAASSTGLFPPEPSLCWAAPPGLQVAGQQAKGPSCSPRQTLGNPEGPLSSSQGSHGSRAAGWRATLPGPRPPRWQASLGHLLLLCPYPFYRVSPGSNGPQETRNQN